jgi:hypothetical protein
MGYGESLREWVMYDIKEVVRHELTNFRYGDLIALNVVCPFTLRSFDKYLRTCYSDRRIRRQHPFRRAWTQLNDHFRTLRRQEEYLRIQDH